MVSLKTTYTNFSFIIRDKKFIKPGEIDSKQFRSFGLPQRWFINEYISFMIEQLKIQVSSMRNYQKRW